MPYRYLPRRHLRVAFLQGLQGTIAVSAFHAISRASRTRGCVEHRKVSGDSRNSAPCAPLNRCALAGDMLGRASWDFRQSVLTGSGALSQWDSPSGPVTKSHMAGVGILQRGLGSTPVLPPKRRLKLAKHALSDIFGGITSWHEIPAQLAIPKRRDCLGLELFLAHMQTKARCEMRTRWFLAASDHKPRRRVVARGYPSRLASPWPSANQALRGAYPFRHCAIGYAHRS